MNNRDSIVLKKMVQYIEEIEATIEQLGITKQSLDENFIARNAVSMCILQIGELTGKLTDEFKEKNNLMPWRDIKAMRNIAAHNYGEIDTEILWETITGDIQELKSYCLQFI